MARTDNFTNFATDVADSIRNMTGKTEKIPASQFDTEILSIKTGGGTLTEKVVYDDGEYFATDDNADGYSKVDVQVLTVKNKQYIIKNGIEDTSVTGGHRFYRVDTTVNGSYTEIQGDGYIDLTCQQWAGIAWEVNNKLNTKKYKTLYIDWAFPNAPTDTSDQANARASIKCVATTQEFRLFQGRSAIERHVDVFKIPIGHDAETINITIANFTSSSSYKNYPLRIYNMWIQEDVDKLENVEKTITTNGRHLLIPSEEYKGFNNVTLNIFTSDTFEPIKNYEMLYHSGNTYDNITGGYRKGYTRNSTSYHNLKMNTDHILMEANRSDGYTATILCLTTQNEINFDGYSKMFVRWNANKTSTTNFGERIGIGSIYNANIGAMGSDTLAQQKFPIEQGTKYTGFFGIPFENIDKGYPIIEMQSNVSGTHNIKLYDLFIVKQDVWKPLCDFVGLLSSDYENEAALINDTAALELILNNTKARQYLINQCTGSLMMEVITNSTALNILQQHEYYYEFIMNEHWLFFLQMAGANTDIDIPDIEDPNDLTDELNTYNTEVTEQGVSIDSIIKLLKNKATGGDFIPTEYVQDGLIANFDARDTLVDGKWKSRIGDDYWFQSYPADGTRMAELKTEDAIVTDSTFAIRNNVDYHVNGYTIELVGKTPGGNTNFFCFDDNQTTHINIGRYGDGIFSPQYLSNGADYMEKVFDGLNNKRCTMAIYLRKTMPKTSSSGSPEIWYSVNGSNWYIWRDGYISGSGSYKSEFCTLLSYYSVNLSGICPAGAEVSTVRVYNRRLTETELANNYQLDKINFGVEG